MSERAHQPAGSDWIHPMSRPPSERDSPGTHGPGEAQAKVQARWATDTLISIRNIRELFSLGRTAAYELTHRSGFPEPIKLSSRCYRWWASEVIAFTADVRPGMRHPVKAARPGGRRIGRRHRTTRRRCVSPGRCASPAAGRHRDTALRLEFTTPERSSWP